MVDTDIKFMGDSDIIKSQHEITACAIRVRENLFFRVCFVVKNTGGFAFKSVDFSDLQMGKRPGPTRPGPTGRLDRLKPSISSRFFRASKNDLFLIQTPFKIADLRVQKLAFQKALKFSTQKYPFFDPKRP